MESGWSEFGRFVDSHPGVFIACWWGWIIGFIGISALLRAQRGKPFFAHVPADATFIEKRASGRSLRNLIGRLGGANRVLLVAVTPTKLIVRPHFPFTLMFLPEVYGLELEVTPSQLRGVEERQSFLRKAVVVKYALPGRGDEEIELRLRDRSGFLAAIQTFRAKRSSR